MLSLSRTTTAVSLARRSCTTPQAFFFSTTADNINTSSSSHNNRKNNTAHHANKLFETRLNKLPATGCMTKVVCTIGPATDTVEHIHDLTRFGMNVARLNFSHAGDDYSYPTQCLERVRAAPGKHYELATGGATTAHAQLLPPNLRAVLVDTKGPEIRYDQNK